MERFLKIQGLFRLLKLSAALLGLIAASSILIITGLICYEVFTRYFLGNPSGWVFDVCGYLLLLVAVFSGVYTEAVDGHINFSMVIVKLRTRLRRVVIFIGAVCGAAYVFVLLSESIKLGLHAMKMKIYTFAHFMIPQMYLYLVITVAAALLFLILVSKGVLSLWSRNESPPAERVASGGPPPRGAQAWESPK